MKMNLKHLFFTTLLLGQFCFAFGQVAQIPFVKYANTNIILQLTINNKADSVLFYFDSGATATLLDSAMAVKLGVNPDSEDEKVGAGGSKKYRIASNQFIHLNNNTILDSTPCVILDLTTLRNKLGINFYGLIGYSILSKYITKIDYDSNKMSLFNFNTPLDTQGYTQIDFDDKIGVPEFTVTMELENGQRLTGKVLFDCGFSGSVMVNTPYKIKTRLKTRIGKTISQEMEGMTGKSNAEIAVIKSIRLGGYEFGEMPILLSSAKEGVNAFDNYLGLVGNEIISRFNFILDYSTNKLFLKPNNSYHRKTDFPVSGLALESKNGGILISGVVSTSSAYQKGLRIGQRILAINNIENGSLEKYRQLLNSSEGTMIDIRYLTKAGVKMQTKIKLKRLI